MKLFVFPQFLEKPKFGGNEMASKYLEKIKSDIEYEFVFFQRTNDLKRNH